MPIDHAPDDDSRGIGDAGIASGEGDGAEEIEASLRWNLDLPRVLDFTEDGDPGLGIFENGDRYLRVDDVVLVEACANVRDGVGHRFARDLDLAEQGKRDEARF